MQIHLILGTRYVSANLNFDANGQVWISQKGFNYSWMFRRPSRIDLVDATDCTCSNCVGSRITAAPIEAISSVNLLEKTIPIVPSIAEFDLLGSNYAVWIENAFWKNLYRRCGDWLECLWLPLFWWRYQGAWFPSKDRQPALWVVHRCNGYFFKVSVWRLSTWNNQRGK